MEKEGYLCEVSWEVCNKVGGIYTVIRSKAPYITPHVPHYLLIGPYFPHSTSIEFIEELIPVELSGVFNEMKSIGLPCRYGRWLIKSEPHVILIDFHALFEQRNDVRKNLWDWFGIDSMNAGFDFDEPVVFSVAAGKLIDALQRHTKQRVVAQFHEWMTGSGLLYLKKTNPTVGTIFTTHATVLGRAAVNSNPNFYSQLASLDVARESVARGVVAKHLVERASAQQATVFTTVSEITGLEAQYILGRKPDVLLPNGIDLENFATFEDLAVKHSELKHSIKDFIMSFFFPYYSFELDDTLIFFVFGRYEFENKGIDVFIESLGRLNEQLKKENSKKTIVSFFFIPADTSGITHGVLESKTVFSDIKNFVWKERNSIIDHVISMGVSSNKAKKQSVLDEAFLDTLKKKVRVFSKKGSPPYSTHDLKFFEQDAIINSFKRANLNNQESDRVKVIFYPAYLKSTDNLLGLDVYDAILGGHLGVFASAYEPWGYTPLESAALGVASVTSDLSGFGQYIEKELKKDTPGVFVVQRFGKSHDEIVDHLSSILKTYVSLDKEQRILNKIEARHIAGLADWKKLIQNYFAAYDRAAA